PSMLAALLAEDTKPETLRKMLASFLEIQPASSAPASAPAAAPAVASAPSARKRLTTALVWGLFLLALGTCVALVALSSMESRPPVNKARLLLNPR
ncbi:hypothetical protein Q8F87_29870, partial [Klebsiella variicola]|nr:hypothetical protein [Klebsiella variicola]